jgi:DNA-binding CsgD family transcriptional regulator
LFTGPDTLIAVNQLLWWGEFAEADELLWLAGEQERGDSSLAHLWAVFGREGGATEPAGSPLERSGPMAVATYLSSAASLAFDGVKTDRPDQMLLGIRAGAPLTPALYDLVVLVRTGRLREAITWCDRLLKEEWINRTPMRRAMIGTIESVALLKAGDSASALHRVQEVFDAVPPLAWGVVAGLPLSVAVRAGTDLGDTHVAQSYLAVPVPPAMFDTPFALPYLLALGRYHLAMGHPESALMHTRSCLELTTRWGVDAGAIAAGPDVSRPPPSTQAGGDDGRRRAGTRRGAHDVARLIELTELTDAEQRVATLAAAGKTNRQIAKSLFITVSTVEQHLTKIYRKLNLRSRSGLRRYAS